MSDIEAREAFPKILAKYMKEHGMNQSDVARYVNVSKQIVSDWLHGKKFPRVDKMQALANLFGVSVSDMYPNENLRMQRKETTNPKMPYIKLKTYKRSMAQSMVRAVVNDPTKQEPYVKLIEKTKRDPQFSDMMKLWEVSSPQTKNSVIGFMKVMNNKEKE